MPFVFFYEVLTKILYWDFDIRDIVRWIGVFCFTRIVVDFYFLCMDVFVTRGNYLTTYGEVGTWAIVTGAEGEMGKEFAKQLAAKGYNIFLISSLQSPTTALTDELSASFPDVKTKSVVVDYRNISKDDLNNLKAELGGLNISMLINAMQAPLNNTPCAFWENPNEEDLDELVTKTCLATLKLTRTIIPLMIPHKRGLILTIGDISASIPTPRLAAFSASHSFLQSWSTALGSELKPHKIYVQLVLGLHAHSGLSEALIPSPQEFVETALKKVGRNGGSQYTGWTSCPYWVHAILLWVWENVPTWNGEFGVDLVRWYMGNSGVGGVASRGKQSGIEKDRFVELDSEES
ncbi:3-ketoacyl-CoA reductase [Halenospora varia]|nr:3-ketoacyl-CoA reductase [Halenospora varia]